LYLPLMTRPIIVPPKDGHTTPTTNLVPIPSGWSI